MIPVFFSLRCWLNCVAFCFMVLINIAFATQIFWVNLQYIRFVNVVWDILKWISYSYWGSARKHLLQKQKMWDKQICNLPKLIYLIRLNCFTFFVRIYCSSVFICIIFHFETVIQYENEKSRNDCASALGNYSHLSLERVEIFRNKFHIHTGGTLENNSSQ